MRPSHGLSGLVKIDGSIDLVKEALGHVQIGPPVAVARHDAGIDQAAEHPPRACIRYSKQFR